MIDRHSERPSSIPTPFAPDHAEHCRDAGDMIADVRSVAAAFFVGARGSHDWDHTRRVCRLCDRMAAAEQADVDVVRIAALLHDIGRARQDASNGSICHAREGARLAGPIVENLPLSGRQKKNVLHCISTHRFRGHRAPETLEAKVLFDADKLDAIGAIGVARAIGFAILSGQPIYAPPTPAFLNSGRTQPGEAHSAYHEYVFKLSKLKDRLHTPSALAIAETRHQLMVQYFETLAGECGV